MQSGMNTGNTSVAEAGRKGGKARAKRLSARERSNAARYAALCRWNTLRDTSDTKRVAAPLVRQEALA